MATFKTKVNNYELCPLIETRGGALAYSNAITIHSTGGQRAVGLKQKMKMRVYIPADAVLFSQHAKINLPPMGEQQKHVEPRQQRVTITVTAGHSEKLHSTKIMQSKKHKGFS